MVRHRCGAEPVRRRGVTHRGGTAIIIYLDAGVPGAYVLQAKLIAQGAQVLLAAELRINHNNATRAAGGDPPLLNSYVRNAAALRSWRRSVRMVPCRSCARALNQGGR